MDKKDFEDKVFGLISYMVVSARNLVEEPPRYGPFRLVDAVSRLIDILAEADVSSHRLNALKEQIESGKYTAMGTDEEFERFLESTVHTVVDAMNAT